jgi:hypothetical protein
MRLPLRLAALTAVLAADLAAQPAAAQWNAGATMNYGMGMGPISLMVGAQSLGRLEIENARRAASPGKGRASAPATVDPARFAFTRSPEVSQAVREQLVTAMSAANPANRPILEQAFANDAVFTQFKALAARYGLSATNVVDVMAMYSLVNWEIVTGGTDAGAGSVRAVRGQLLRAAADNAALQKATNADRQRLAELMAYQVMMEAALNDAFHRQGDAEKLQALRGSVREAAMRMGPDPTRLKLTEAGFVPAS